MTALVALVGVLGLAVGSFLNVVVHRVPLGQSVVAPASRCPGCEREILRRDNVPVLSWVLLRGRCRNCGTGISVRYPVVELVTGLLFAAVAWRVGLSWALPAYLYLTAIAVALSAIDFDVHRLPDVIVLPSYLVTAGLLLVASAGTGNWWALVRALAGGTGLLAAYFALFVAKPGGMGFGDVKLAGVLGLHLGWLGWSELLVGAFLAFLVGGLVSVGLLTLRRAGRRSRIPFGPFMLAGAVVAVFVGGAVGQWYVGLFGLASA